MRIYRLFAMCERVHFVGPHGQGTDAAEYYFLRPIDSHSL
jgi:hypothetical protein